MWKWPRMKTFQRAVRSFKIGDTATMEMLVGAIEASLDKAAL